MTRYSPGVLIRETEDPNGRQKVVEIADDMIFTQFLKVAVVVFIPKSNSGVRSDTLSDVTNLGVQ
jgi:hypothetical protein